MSHKKSIDLKTIPGVGKAIEKDLNLLGIKRPADLAGKSPERLYERLCRLQGRKVDRCMLYVFRCAVYFASNEHHEPHLLKWWSWKDGAGARP